MRIVISEVFNLDSFEPHGPSGKVNRCQSRARERGGGKGKTGCHSRADGEVSHFSHFICCRWIASSLHFILLKKKNLFSSNKDFSSDSSCVALSPLEKQTEVEYSDKELTEGHTVYQQRSGFLVPHGGQESSLEYKDFLLWIRSPESQF